MAFAKKLFFTVLVLAILENSASAPSDPWSNITWYLSADIKSWLPQSGIALNPFEIVLLVVLLVWALRGRKDRRFHFERGLLFWPVVVFGGLLLFSLLWGAIQPGDNFTVALWEVRALGLGILVYFLIGILFTHRRDLDTLTWAILISTLFLGIEDLLRYEVFLPNHVVGDLSYDHADATILAFTILLSLGMLALGSTHRQRVFVFFSLPIETIAMMVTHRRAGEAALAIGLVFMALILLRVNKKLFLQVVPVTALILSLYVAAEWNCNSGSAICQPARAISSQFNPDPRDASSDQYRLTERYDLVLNIQANTITGLGFGREYIFYIPLPDESFWPFWHYTPHDEILWVWAKMGIVGFIAFWWLIASALYRSGRLTQALSAAGDNKARALLAAAACLIIMQMSVSYVDLGLTDDRPMLILWIMLGVIGHLPGILRRSTNTDVPDRSMSPINGKGVDALDKETPEVQVGVLAHALIAPTEPASPSQRDPWSQHRNVRNETSPRWRQSNGANGAGHTSHPLSGVAPAHTSRSLASSRSATEAPEASSFDELDLPWITHSEE